MLIIIATLFSGNNYLNLLCISYLLCTKTQWGTKCKNALNQYWQMGQTPVGVAINFFNTNKPRKYMYIAAYRIFRTLQKKHTANTQQTPQKLIGSHTHFFFTIHMYICMWNAPRCSSIYHRGEMIVDAVLNVHTENNI